LSHTPKRMISLDPDVQFSIRLDSPAHAASFLNIRIRRAHMGCMLLYGQGAILAHFLRVEKWRPTTFLGSGHCNTLQHFLSFIFVPKKKLSARCRCPKESFPCTCARQFLGFANFPPWTRIICGLEVGKAYSCCAAWG